MFRDVCGNVKAKVQFSNAEKQRWTGDTEKSFTCLHCEGQKQVKKCFPCLQCGRHWLASGFDGKEHLEITDDREAPVMTCYPCVGLNETWKLMLEEHKCQGCKRTLAWSAYDPILLAYLLKQEKKRGFSVKQEVYCDDCKYPPCAVLHSPMEASNRYASPQWAVRLPELPVSAMRRWVWNTAVAAPPRMVFCVRNVSVDVRGLQEAQLSSLREVPHSPTEASNISSASRWSVRLPLLPISCMHGWVWYTAAAFRRKIFCV